MHYVQLATCFKFGNLYQIRQITKLIASPLQKFPAILHVTLGTCRLQGYGSRVCVCVSVLSVYLYPQNQLPTSFLSRKQSFIGFFMVFSTLLPFGFP